MASSHIQLEQVWCAKNIHNTIAEIWVLGGVEIDSVSGECCMLIHIVKAM